MEKKINIKYEDHPFVQATRKVLSSGLSNNVAVFSKTAPEPWKYVSNVYQDLNKIQHTFDILRMCRVFLAERHPNIARAVNSESSITIAEYIKYHIENYFLRVTTYKDQCQKLYIKVFNLPIPENMGRGRELRKYINNEKHIDLEKLITSLDDLLSKASEIRNRIAHGDSFIDQSITLIDSGADYISDTSSDKDKFDKDAFDCLVANCLSNNIIDMTNNEQTLESHRLELLNNLYEQYIKVIEGFNFKL